MKHLLLLLLTASFLSAAASEWPTRIELDVGETLSVSRNGGPAHQFRLLSISHQTMPYRRREADGTIIYAATAQLELDGTPVTLTARPYQFPTVAGGLRLLIENTSEWSESGTIATEAQSKDLIISFTNAGEPWGPADVRFPIAEFRWRATTYHNTWMGLVPQDDHIYYHRGEDFGALANQLQLIAPRDGAISSVPWVNVIDADGAQFQFYHMFPDHIYVSNGQYVSRGTHLAETGGYGNSSSDPHLHISLTPPGSRLSNTYPLMAESYLRDYPDSGIAVAGGYQFMAQGGTIQLDASRSLARPGRTITGYRWILHDGTQVDGPTTSLTIGTPGYYDQELRVSYDDGSEQRDFTPVRVFGDGAGQTGMLGLIYQHPMRGIQPGTPVMIHHYTWTPGSGVGPRTINFGDGTPTQSFAGSVTRTYAAPGLYTVTITADSNQVLKTSVLVEGAAPANAAPTVSAGPDRAITLPATASLDGTVSDDGLPAGSALTQTWSTVSGPGTVTFGDASAVDTTAAFSAAGTYVLRLTASDRTLSANDTVTVVVTAAAPSNTAPVANAGTDQTITLPATATLSGSATDDGLPAGASLSYAWTTTSGPGTVTFASSTSAGTTASFSAAGTYVLQLAVSDTALSGTDTITITVNPAAAGNAAPVVDAGPDRAITLPATASLDGTVGDDGLPGGSALTQIWTTISGPGSVTFGNAGAVDTSATFNAAGTYVLRLTASDGTLSASDTITVVVTAAPTVSGATTLDPGTSGPGCGTGGLVAILGLGTGLFLLRRR